MVKSGESRVLDQYVSNIETLTLNMPDQMNTIRREAIENFRLSGFPSKKVEEYRHSDVVKSFARDWKLSLGSVDQVVDRSFNIDCYKLEIGNGIVDGDIIESPAGIVCGSIKAVAERYPSVVNRLGELSNSCSDAMVYVNGAFMQDVCVVYVPEGVVVDKPVVLEYKYLAIDGQMTMVTARTLIVVEERAEVDFVINHSDDGEVLINYLRESIISDGAKVNFTEISNLSPKSVSTSACFMSQGADSVVTETNIWFGGALTRWCNRANINGERSENRLSALYAIGGESRCDIQNMVCHNSANCSSYQQIKGLAAANSIGAFTGGVYVAPDAQKIDAVQQSRNLLIGDKARVYTEPQLEIYADDVKCSHGATIGQIDDESIYYMRQRGISELEARKLQMNGFVNDVIMNVKIEGVYDYISSISDSFFESL